MTATLLDHPTPIFDDATRRQFLAGLAAAGLLAGCGADSDDSNTASAATGAFPVRIDHALGTTEIPALPERIVSVGIAEQDILLALGVVPVAVTEWFGDRPHATWPWAQDELGSATPTVLSSVDSFQYERIAAEDPDLIVGTNAGLDAQSYGLLSGIAPTLAHGAGQLSYKSPWEIQARSIAEALGLQQRARDLIADLSGQFAAAAAAHPEFAGTKVIRLQGQFYEGQAVAALGSGGEAKHLIDLGFTVPTSIDEFKQGENQAIIPLERLGVLDDADLLTWDTGTAADRAALEAIPLYRTLKAVREGKVVFTEELLAAASSFRSPLSYPYLLDRLVPLLARAPAGEGPQAAFE